MASSSGAVFRIGRYCFYDRKCKKSTDVDKAIEWQADKLGNDLLMPSGQVEIAYYRLRDKTNDIIAALAEQFNVSKQAMEINLKAQHLI